MLVAKKLRREHGFHGYIHLKTIPEASPWLIEQAGLWADRLSINLELPTRGEPQAARAGEGRRLDRAARWARCASASTRREAERPDASRPPASDADHRRRRRDDRRGRAAHQRGALPRLRSQARLLFGLQPDPGRQRGRCRRKAPPLQRENRLYQADWLLRYYGFAVDEIADGGEDGMLDLDIDPKLAWALKHRDRFPVDVNSGRARDAAARAGPRRARGRPDPARRAGTARLGSTISRR